MSFDHQNHSKWHKWCHVRYTVDGPVAAEDEDEVQGDVRRRRRTSWNHRQRPSGSFRRGLDGACRPRQRWGDPHRAAEGASLLPPQLSDDNVTLDIISVVLCPLPPHPLPHRSYCDSSSSGGSLPMPHNDGSSSSSSPHLTLSGMDGVKVWGFG